MRDDSETGGLVAALDALDAAILRYEANITDANATWAAATECLMWIIAIDSEFEDTQPRYREQRSLDVEGNRLPLLRDLRNGLVHAITKPAVAHAGDYGPEFSDDFDLVRLVWQLPEPPPSGERRSSSRQAMQERRRRIAAELVDPAHDIKQDLLAARSWLRQALG